MASRFAALPRMGLDAVGASLLRKDLSAAVSRTPAHLFVRSRWMPMILPGALPSMAEWSGRISEFLEAMLRLRARGGRDPRLSGWKTCDLSGKDHSGGMPMASPLRPRKLQHRRLGAFYPTDPLVPYPLSPWPTAFLIGFALILLAVIFIEARTHVFETALLILVGAGFFAVYADRSARRTWKTMLAVRERAIGALHYAAAWQRVPKEGFAGDLAMLLRAHGNVVGLLDQGGGTDAERPEIRGRTVEGELLIAFCLPGEDLGARRFQALLGSAIISGANVMLVASTGQVSEEARRLAEDVPDHLLRVEIWDAQELARKVLDISDEGGERGLLPWAEA